MNHRLQLIIILLLLVAFATLINMIRNRKLELRYALSWLFVDAAVLVLTTFPMIIQYIADFFGIASAMNLLFFAGFCFSLVLIFVLTVSVSKMSIQIKDLTQQIALKEKELKGKEIRNEE